MTLYWELSGTPMLFCWTRTTWLFFHDLNVASLCQTLIQGWGVYLFSPCLFPPLLRPLGNWGWGGFREARPCWPIWPQASLFICGPGRGQSTSFYCSLDLPTTHSWRHIVLIQSLKRNQPSFRYFAICQEPPQRPVIFPVEYLSYQPKTTLSQENIRTG